MKHATSKESGTVATVPPPNTKALAVPASDWSHPPIRGKFGQVGANFHDGSRHQFDVGGVIKVKVNLQVQSNVHHLGQLKPCPESKKEKRYSNCLFHGSSTKKKPTKSWQKNRLFRSASCRSGMKSPCSLTLHMENHMTFQIVQRGCA